MHEALHNQHPPARTAMAKKDPKNRFSALVQNATRYAKQRTAKKGK